MATPEQITAAYQKYLGRSPSQSDLEAWVGNDNFEAEIAASPEAQARLTPQNTGGPPGLQMAPPGPGLTQGFHFDPTTNTWTLAGPPTGVGGYNPNAGGNPVSFAQVDAAYQKYLGRHATQTDYAAWAGNPAFEQSIANSPEARLKGNGGWNNFANLPGFDATKMADPNKQNAKYNPAARMMSMAMAALGLDGNSRLTDQDVDNIAAWARANGMGNAKVGSGPSHDTIDFGDGNGPVDIRRSDGAPQMLQPWTYGPPGPGDNSPGGGPFNQHPDFPGGGGPGGMSLASLFGGGQLPQGGGFPGGLGGLPGGFGGFPMMSGWMPAPTPRPFMYTPMATPGPFQPPPMYQAPQPFGTGSATPQQGMRENTGFQIPFGGNGSMFQPFGMGSTSGQQPAPLSKGDLLSTNAFQQPWGFAGPYQGQMAQKTTNDQSQYGPIATTGWMPAPGQSPNSLYGPPQMGQSSGQLPQPTPGPSMGRRGPLPTGPVSPFEPPAGQIGPGLPGSSSPNEGVLPSPWGIGSSSPNEGVLPSPWAMGSSSPNEGVLPQPPTGPDAFPLGDLGTGNNPSLGRRGPLPVGSPFYGSPIPNPGGSVGDVPTAPTLNYTPYTPSPIDLPNALTPQAFTAPTQQDLLSDPGYLERLQRGQQAIDQSAAAKGVLHTGGTLKGLSDWASGTASDEYNNLFQRNLAATQANNAALAQAYGLTNQYQTAINLANQQNGLQANQLNNQNALNFGNTNFQNALSAQGQGYGQAANTYQMNVQNQRQAQNDAFNQALASYGINTSTQLQANNQQFQQQLAALGFNNASDLQQYQAEMGANLGWGQLGLGYGNLGLGYQQAANQFALGQGQLGLGYYNADISRELGLGNLGLGYYNAANNYNLGMGNLGLGYYNAANNYNLGMGNLGLGYYNAGNNYNLGLGNLGLQWNNQNFNQDLATWQANLGMNNQQFQQFLALANLGLGANGQIGNAGGNYGSLLAQLLGGLGNVNAGNTIGQNNNWQNWLSILAGLSPYLMSQNPSGGQLPQPTGG